MEVSPSDAIVSQLSEEHIAADVSLDNYQDAIPISTSVDQINNATPSKILQQIFPLTQNVRKHLTVKTSVYDSSKGWFVAAHTHR